MVVTEKTSKKIIRINQVSENNESVDRNFLSDNRELLATMVGDYLGYLGEKYELTTVMNEELKTLIINKSVIYTSAISNGGFSVSNFEECYFSEEINAIPSFVVPSEFRKNLENEIDEVIQEDLENKKEELFIIKSDKHLGRQEKLYMYILHQIKLMYKQHLSVFPMGLPYVSFEKSVWLSYDLMVNRAIQFSLCYEANPKDYEMCRKILIESALNSENYHYRLEKHVDIELEKQIGSFLKTFLNKKFDLDIFNVDMIIKVLLKIINKSKKIDEELKETLVETVRESKEIDEEFKESLVKTIKEAEYLVIGAKESLVKKIKASNKDEFQEALVNTIQEAEKAIDKIFHFDAYEDCQKCRQVRQEYADLFKNSIERVINPDKLKNFKVALKKAKLNYVSKYKDQYIYTFVYDLIVMSFSFSIKSELYKSHIEKTNILAKSINEMKYKYIDNDSDENYIFEDLLQLIEVLPDEFKNVDPALLIIKHYSEILEADYEDIATVLRQLRFELADKNKPVYAFPKHTRSIKLSIDDDHFRILSLDIM